MLEIRSLTSLRGIFALMILAYHSLQTFLGNSQPILAFGVNGFFGLSGFLLYRIYANNFNVKRFTIRRILRIVPLYVVGVAAFYYRVMIYFTPLWSIYTEEMFYFGALPLIIKFRPSTRILVTLGVVSQIAQYVFVPPVVASSGFNWIIYALLPFQFLPFALGISIARMKITPGRILHGIDRVLGNRVLMFLGTISYGIYLLHVPCLSWFGIFGIPATIGLATFTYFTFEKRFIEWSRHLTSNL